MIRTLNEAAVANEGLAVEMMDRIYSGMVDHHRGVAQAFNDQMLKGFGIVAMNWPDHLTVDLSNRVAALTWIGRQSR